MKRLLNWGAVFITAVAAVVFALANRMPVRLSLDPFSTEAPAVAIDAPLFLIVMVAILVGIAVGGLSAWFAGGKNRSAGRQHKRKARKLEKELEAAKVDTNVPALPPAESGDRKAA